MIEFQWMKPNEILERSIEIKKEYFSFNGKNYCIKAFYSKIPMHSYIDVDIEKFGIGIFKVVNFFLFKVLFPQKGIVNLNRKQLSFTDEKNKFVEELNFELKKENKRKNEKPLNKEEFFEEAFLE